QKQRYGPQNSNRGSFHGDASYTQPCRAASKFARLSIVATFAARPAPSPDPSPSSSSFRRLPQIESAPLGLQADKTSARQRGTKYVPAYRGVSTSTVRAPR